MIRGLWDRETVALLLIAAYLPLAAIWLWFEGAEALWRLALCGLVLGFWHLVFLLARAQAPSLAAAVTALAVAMLAPEEIGAPRLVLGLSFGAVMGELVFGGWGRNVVNPAVVALAFLGFGFPAFGWPEFVAPVGWAVLPSAALGLVLGVFPAALLAGATLVLGAAALAGSLDMAMAVMGGLGLVLLLADPVTSPATTLGRWLGGAFYGALILLFAGNWIGAEPVQIVVSAALLTSLAAPLLDEGALALWVAQRERRHGRD